MFNSAPLNTKDPPFAKEAIQQPREALPEGVPLARRRRLRDRLRDLIPGVKRSPGAQVERIRAAMLQELAQLPNPENAKPATVAASAQRCGAIAMQITEAEDAEMLWRLRSKLAQAIGTDYSPVVVHQRMTEISFMFAGLLQRRAPHPGDNVVQLPTRTPPHHHQPSERSPSST